MRTGRLASWLRLSRQLVDESRQLICLSSELSSPTTVFTCRLSAFLLLSLDMDRWKLTPDEVRPLAEEMRGGFELRGSFQDVFMSGPDILAWVSVGFGSGPKTKSRH